MSAWFTGDILHLNGYSCHWRLAWRQYNIVKIHIAIGATKVFQFETDNLDALHKTLTVGIECVKGVDGIVFSFVRG